MQAAVYLLGNSTCLQNRGGATDALSTARAAAALLEAILDAAPQSASQALHDEGGLLTIRMCITCAKLGTAYELEVCHPLFPSQPLFQAGSACAKIYDTLGLILPWKAC